MKISAIPKMDVASFSTLYPRVCVLKQPGPKGAQSGPVLQSPGTFPFGDDVVVTARGDGRNLRFPFKPG